MSRTYVAMPAPTATNNSSPFFESLMDEKSLITQAQVAKALFFKYAIVLKHCFINIFDISPCLISFT